MEQLKAEFDTIGEPSQALSAYRSTNSPAHASQRMKNHRPLKFSGDSVVQYPLKRMSSKSADSSSTLRQYIKRPKKYQDSSDSEADMTVKRRKRRARQSHASKTYKCPTPGCGRAYLHQAGLYTHQRFECQVPPGFMCPYCPYKTAHSSAVRKHIVNRHKNHEVKVVELRQNIKRQQTAGNSSMSMRFLL